MIKLITHASGKVLGDRKKAMLIRGEINNALAIPKTKIDIDFGGDLIITQSFIDELIGVLVMDEGKEVLNRIQFHNLSEKNEKILRFVIHFRLTKRVA